MTTYLVQDCNTDEVLSAWDNYQDAECAAAEVNADWPYGVGPYMVVEDKT
jgi:hypothetical protein